MHGILHCSWSSIAPTTIEASICSRLYFSIIVDVRTFPSYAPWFYSCNHTLVHVHVALCSIYHGYESFCVLKFSHDKFSVEKVTFVQTIL